MACPDIEELVAYGEGGLGAGARASLEEHMDQCRRCRCAASEAARSAFARSSQRDDAEAEEPVLSGDASELIGQRMARFEILSPLGSGATGWVFLARDPQLEREIALKVLRPAAFGADSTLGRERMLREGRALARVTHDNVVTVYEVGSAGAYVYVAMEYVRGGNLGEWLAAESRSSEEILDVFVSVAHGLAAIHDAGVLHRDLKSQNILIGSDGRPQVADLGLARFEGERSGGSNEAPSQALAATLTNTGVSIGTPAYMAPEILRGESATVASDIYALGVALFEALDGERPFAQESLSERLAAASAISERLATSRVPARLQPALLRALAFESSERFASAHELVTALQAHRTARKSRRARVGAALVLVACAGAGVWMWQERSAAEVCAQAGAGVAATWDAHRDELSAAFAKVEAPYAEALATRVLQDADDYRRRLALSQANACREREGASPELQALLATRSACLAQLAQSFATTLEVWSAAPGERLTFAPRALSSLGDPERCALATASEGGLDPRLVDALARAHAGDQVGAAPQIETLIRELPKGSYGQLLARMERAALLREERKNTEARTEWRQVIVDAEAIGADDLRAESWIHLASLAGDEGGDVDEASEALELARSVVERVGSRPRFEEMLLMAQARLSIRTGAASEAIEALEGALAIPASPFDEALKRHLLARAYAIRGEAESMVRELERAKALLVEAGGPYHPDIVPVFNSMVEAYSNAGQPDKALAAGEDARALAEKLGGANDRRLASILNNLSILYGETGDHERALALMERALEISASFRGPTHPDLAIDRINIAGVYLDLGRHEDAAEQYTLARTALVDALGEEHVQVSYADLGLAQVYAADKNYSEAIRLARQAIQSRQRPDLEPYLAVYAQAVLVDIYKTAGMKAERRAHCREAIAALPPATTERQQALADDLKTLCTGR